MKATQAVLATREICMEVLYMEHDCNDITLEKMQREESKACDDKEKQRRRGCWKVTA